MTNILFFDTETTGLIPKENFQFEKVLNYPKLVQLSALLYSEEGELLKTLDYIIKPNNFEINNCAIHGITTDIANRDGQEVELVLQEFKRICSEANLLVCHNYAFDSAIVKSELLRNNNFDFLSEMPSFCTMTECSSLTKSISLKNLHNGLFNTDFSDHHNSLVDTQITAKCFFELIKQGKLIKKGTNYIFNNSKDKEFQFELDRENTKFFNAFTLISETDKSIFLTGKAGTGKTTFLKYLRNNTNKKIVTLAFTGVAAINAGGQTINSFFQLPPRPFLPDDMSLKKENIFNFLKYTSNKRDIIRSIDILVIDEVSMVRADIIDAIDQILRIFRKKEHMAFGGVQVIFIGDLFQLPPIEGDDWTTIRSFYHSPYFFDSKIIENLVEKGDIICYELDKVYRQSEIEFIEVLNRIRVGKHSTNDLLKINSKDNKVENINSLLSDNYIVLSTTNQKVNTINDTKLQEIKSESFTFLGSVNGDFPDSMKIAPQLLEFKLDAQVMLLKNIGGSNYNGKIGKITALKENYIEVHFDGNLNSESIEKAEWSKIEYSYNKEKHKIEEVVKGTYTQYPLKLAWAITVHKSQGLTFNKVIADVSTAFASGQVYVALSRCTSLNGLKFTAPLPLNAIKVDSRVVKFSNIQTPDTTVISFINDGKADSLYKSFRQLITKNSIEEAFLKLEQAIKYRNDIFTTSFQKFVHSYVNKFKNYQNIVLELNKVTKSLILENELLKKENISLSNSNRINTDDFHNQIRSEQNNNSKLNKRIEKLENELKSLKTDLNSKEIENKKQVKNLEELSQRLIIANNGLSNKNSEIIDLNKKNAELKNKLDSLKSKWFVKVFD